MAAAVAPPVGRRCRSAGEGGRYKTFGSHPTSSLAAFFDLEAVKCFLFPSVRLRFHCFFLLFFLAPKGSPTELLDSYLVERTKPPRVSRRQAGLAWAPDSFPRLYRYIDTVHLFAGRYDTETNNNSLSLTRALAAANNLIRQTTKYEKRQKQPCWISNKSRNTPSLARVRRSTQLLAFFPSRGSPFPSLPVTRTLPHHPCLLLPHSVGSSCIPRYSVDSPACTR